MSATDIDAPMVTVPRVNFPSEIVENVLHTLSPVSYSFHFISVFLLFVNIDLDFHCLLQAWPIHANSSIYVTNATNILFC